MWPDRVSNPGPLTYRACALPTALRGPAYKHSDFHAYHHTRCHERTHASVNIHGHLTEVCMKVATHTHACASDDIRIIRT